MPIGTDQFSGKLIAVFEDEGLGADRCFIVERVDQAVHALGVLLLWQEASTDHQESGNVELNGIHDGGINDSWCASPPH